MTSGAIESELSCVRCGYDLRGLVERRCPECGLAFDPTAPPPADLPWMRRRHIGRFWAYWRTVFFIVASPRTFADQAWRWVTVSPRDGEWFRLATVVIAAVSLAAAYELVLINDRFIVATMGRMEILQTFAAAAGALLAFFFVATLRVPIRMSHANSIAIEQRFAYLQKFLCAPLGLAPLVPLAVGASALAGWTGLMNDDALVPVFMLASLCLAIAWIRTCAMYLVMAGKVKVIAVIAYAWVSALLWVAAVLAGTFAGAAAAGLVGTR